MAAGGGLAALCPSGRGPPVEKEPAYSEEETPLSRSDFMEQAKRYIGVLVGSAILAIALDAFTVPNRIAAGGVSGLATILYHQFGWPVGVTMLATNIPLFAFGTRVLGAQFGILSFVGAIASSLFVDLFAPFLPPLTTDPLLASIYGGVITGLGIGITFRYGGSTGGTDIAARLLHHVSRMGIGNAFIVLDGFVILAAAFAFNAELALYAFLSLVIASKTLDLMQGSGPYAKGAVIITEKAEAVGKAIMERLDRGVTMFQGQGVFSGKERPALFVVVHRPQIHELNTLVREIDDKAFMVITDVADVLGEGFERE